jgi:thioredoxin reductase (NADPH)
MSSNCTRNDDLSDARKGLPLTSSRIEKIFPKLTPAQISRIAAHGHIRSVQPGEVLMEQGDASVPFFVVITGEVEIVRPFGAHETLVTVHGSGQFTGEVNMLSGRRSLIRARATKPGKVIELHHQQVLTLVQTDAELGEILMRAFILRRVELIAAGVGDIILIGSTQQSPFVLMSSCLCSAIFHIQNGFSCSLWNSSLRVFSLCCCEISFCRSLNTIAI